MSVIESEGHRHWVPLAMDQTPDEVGAALRQRFASEGTPDEGMELHLAAAQGIAANLHQQAATSADDGIVVCAAWVLIPEPARFEVRAVATLRAVGVVPGLETSHLVDDVVGEGARHGDPVVEPFETWSGEAHSIRYRPIVESGGEQQVHQVNAVLWDRADQGVAFVLSCYVDDLVEAGDVGDLLDELAAGMRGI